MLAARQLNLPPALRHRLERQRLLCQRGEGLGRRRWHTRTSPRVEVVEVHARTTIERLLERSQLSSSIPGLRTRRAATLETDADNLEDRPRRVDDT